MSRGLLEAFLTGLSRNVAFTSPGSLDPRLRGRTYAIPFEEVWRASNELVGGSLKRWDRIEADDEEGVIRGVARGRIERFTSAITIRITLDEDAQTRVDALAASRSGRSDLGSNARKLHRFFTALDARIAASRGARIEAYRLDLETAPAGR